MKEQLIAAMEEAKGKKVTYQIHEDFRPTVDVYRHIQAITYDGIPLRGGKTKIFAYYGFPKDQRADSPVPAVLLVHGGGGHSYMEWVRIWNDRGYAALAMDLTGSFPHRGNTGQTEGDKGVWDRLKDSAFDEAGYVTPPDPYTYPASQTQLDNHWAYYAVGAVILGGNLLRQDPRIDGEKIGITGISWGGTLTTQTIGFDNRFAFAIPIYGMAYLGGKDHPFSRLDDPDLNRLWGAEHYLDNATMPILWLAYNDDNNFTVSQYVNSYLRTEKNNEKNVLLMLGDWGHSHKYGWKEEASYHFADWIIHGRGGFVTFASQPAGNQPDCRLRIPESASDVSADLIYLTEAMSYSNHVKHGMGPYIFLDQDWKTRENCLTVDPKSGRVSGVIPPEAAGYYIRLRFTAEGRRCASDSVYVALK